MIFRFVLRGWLFLLIVLFVPAQSSAFYEAAKGDNGVSLRGFVDAGAGLTRNPADHFTYGDRGETVWHGDLRLLANAWLGGHFRVEANVLENIRSAPSLDPAGLRGDVRGVERSSLLAWQQQDSGNSQAGLVLDNVNLRWNGENSELIVGRQPVSLATTFFFTPNDFFAPFAARNLYRVYKPGVDAARFDLRLSDLSQFTLIGVLGYHEEQGASNGWSRAPDWRRTSLVGRLTQNRGDFEWGLVAGRVRDCRVLGASLQGDLFHWLGIRAEGHYQDTEKDNQRNGLEISLGLEHRFAGSLTARLEYFFHGSGYHSMAEADKALITGTVPVGYLGRNYTAFDLSYEFSPLLTGEFLLLKNWTDSSGLFSLYAVYSLSDESEIALTAVLPRGDNPVAAAGRSEFGSLPVRFSLEYRFYF